MLSLPMTTNRRQKQLQPAVTMMKTRAVTVKSSERFTAAHYT